MGGHGPSWRKNRLGFQEPNIHRVLLSLIKSLISSIILVIVRVLVEVSLVRGVVLKKTYY